jgi:Peptidase family M23
VGISASDFPYTGPYSVEGNGKHKGNTAIAMKRAMARLGWLPWEPEKWDNVFNNKLEDALDRWDGGKNGYAEGRWEKIRNAKIPKGIPHAGEWALDSECKRLVKEEAKKAEPWANLGPVFNGGASVLAHDCTHLTSGIPLYPAFDDAFTQGTTIIAPEEITITRDSSSNPGDACYADGKSGLRYWFGHLASAPAVGKKIAKGNTIGKVCANSVGGGPHVHVGVNVERLWGSGKQLKAHDNYTHGAPLIGDQLGSH